MNASKITRYLRRPPCATTTTTTTVKGAVGPICQMLVENTAAIPSIISSLDSITQANTKWLAHPLFDERHKPRKLCTTNTHKIWIKTWSFLVDRLPLNSSHKKIPFKDILHRTVAQNLKLVIYELQFQTFGYRSFLPRNNVRVQLSFWEKIPWSKTCILPRNFSSDFLGKEWKFLLDSKSFESLHTGISIQ